MDATKRKRADRIVARIAANVEALHAREITHETFRARQRAAWADAETDPEVEDWVCEAMRRKARIG